MGIVGVKSECSEKDTEMCESGRFRGWESVYKAYPYRELVRIKNQ